MSGFLDPSKLSREQRRILTALAADPGNYLSRGIRGIWSARDRTGKRLVDAGLTWPTIERYAEEGWIKGHGSRQIVHHGAYVATPEAVDLLQR